MSRKNTIIRGTFLLTFAGIITKIIGFYYRIFLNNHIGAAGLGLYQLVFPVFIMGFAFCCIGIQTSMSRMIAEHTNDSVICIKILTVATFYCVLLSCAVWFLSYFKSDWIALYFLKNKDCSPLVKILAFSFVPASVHSCISGYYYGMKKTVLPALSQLLEQISRVIIVYFMLKLPENKLNIVMWGLVFGECVAAFVSLTYLLFDNMINSHNTTSSFIKKNFVNNSVFSRTKILKKMTKELFNQAIPLTLNRIGTNFLQSVEAILFPIMLCEFGYNNNDAITCFGILTGITMPLIMFPSALTNSLSVLLLSDVAEQNSNNNNRKIRNTIEYTVEYTVLLGIFCFGMFFIMGDKIGTIIFSSNMAGYYIKLMSFLCPFIYLSSVLKSVLYGLGKTMHFFVCNIVVLISRLIFMWVFMPYYGVNSYIFIMLTGQIAMTIFVIIELKISTNMRFDFTKWIIRPIICVIASFVLIKSAEHISYIFNGKCFWGIKKAGLSTPAFYLAINCLLYCIPFMIYFKKVYSLLKAQKNQ